MDSPIGVNMPYNLEAEQAILAGAIMNENALSSVMEALTEEDFYVTAHKTLYNAINTLFSTGRPVDMVTVSGELGEKLDSIGGISYLSKILQGFYTAENLRHYIDIARSETTRRRLIEAGSEIVDMSVKGDDETEIILDRSEQLIFNIGEKRGAKGFTHIGEVVKTSMALIEQLKKRGSKIVGIPTGFRKLDELTAGLQRSDLVIIAARPGVGKTSLALNMAETAAIRNKAVTAIFSLEMSKEQLVNRVLASEALIELGKLRVGSIGPDDMTKLAHALKDVVTAPIYIDDTPGITVSEIRAKCRRLKMEKGLDLVVIDYLQLMQGSNRREGNRAIEIGEISRSLKIMAKELDVPVITLAQLNRSSVKENREPRISDLRESGSIEQDADLILLLYPPVSSDGEEDAVSNTIECSIAKNRAGATGVAEMAWRAEYTKFTDLDPRE